MKYFITFAVYAGIFCACIQLSLWADINVSLTLCAIFGLFAFVIGAAVFLKLQSIERKLDEEKEDDAQLGARTHKNHFRKQNDN